MSLTDGQNVIGGTSAGSGNVISGNNGSGIYLWHGALDVVAGNMIGTDAAGTAALPNQGPGIRVQAGSQDTILGNVVSGNAGDGIDLAAAVDDLVAGNKIGTDTSGANALRDAGFGVLVQNGGSGNTIGGLTATAGTGPGNVIAANEITGVAIGAGGNVVEGNLIGTDSSGTVAMGNLTGVGIERVGQHDRRDGRRVRQRDLGQYLLRHHHLQRGLIEPRRRQPDRHRYHGHGRAGERGRRHPHLLRRVEQHDRWHVRRGRQPDLGQHGRWCADRRKPAQHRQGQSHWHQRRRHGRARERTGRRCTLRDRRVAHAYGAERDRRDVRGRGQPALGQHQLRHLYHSRVPRRGRGEPDWHGRRRDRGSAEWRSGDRY